MRKHLHLSLILMCLWLTSYSQFSLEYSLHSIRAGDRLLKQEVSDLPLSNTGENILWDFRSITTINDSYPLVYFYDNEEDTTLVIGFEHKTTYHYLLSDSLLLLKSYSNRKVEMDFEAAELQLSFPLHYGDTLSGSFRGEGFYYRDYYLPAFGRTHIHADAKGSILLPGGDTLNHVLRVKRLRNYDEIGSEGQSLQLETYLWYVKGYRYPIFESVTGRSFTDGKWKQSSRTNFYYPPVGFADLDPDPENEALRNEPGEEERLILAAVISPNPAYDEAMVSFTLSSDAKVQIRLCDILGNTLLLIEPGGYLQAGEYSYPFNISPYNRGHYPVVITAGNEKLTQLLLKK